MINNLPIPDFSIKDETILNKIVFLLLFVKSFNNSLIKDIKFILDAGVFELYFPDHMKEQKIAVLQFVEKDIEEVMQDNEFETLSETQKEQIITELHTRWSDPDSEIVKRMNSFSEKSPDILKPILES